MNDDAAKRELTTLLRDFHDNIASAGFVCGRPVELLPAAERDRLIKGFCTAANEQVFLGSMKSLDAASRYPFPEAELKRINDAKEMLGRFVPILNSFLTSNIALAEFKQRVREVLHKPIPQGEEDRVDEISRLVGTVKFLAAESLSEKDRWDQLIDCSQMHDVLVRMAQVCGALQNSASKGMQEAALARTLELTLGQITEVESFFCGELALTSLGSQFKLLASELESLWSSTIKSDSATVKISTSQ